MSSNPTLRHIKIVKLRVDNLKYLSHADVNAEMPSYAQRVSSSSKRQKPAPSCS